MNRDSNNGALLTTGYNRGTLFSNSPLFNPDEWQMYDSSLKSECCEAGLCNVYFERRPTDECTLYQPLSFGEIIIRKQHELMSTWSFHLKLSTI